MEQSVGLRHVSDRRAFTVRLLSAERNPFIIRLMTDTAHDYHAIQPATTEGLEELFEVADISVQDSLREKSPEVHAAGVP